MIVFISVWRKVQFQWFSVIAGEIIFPVKCFSKKYLKFLFFCKNRKNTLREWQWIPGFLWSGRAPNPLGAIFSKKVILGSRITKNVIFSIFTKRSLILLPSPECLFSLSFIKTFDCRFIKKCRFYENFNIFSKKWF